MVIALSAGAAERQDAVSGFLQPRQIVLLYDEHPELPRLAMLDAGFILELTSGSFHVRRKPTIVSPASLFGVILTTRNIYIRTPTG